MSTAYYSADLASIQFLNGPQMGRVFPINKTPVKIGRDPSCDIVVSDPTVSRFHAQLTYKGTFWSIEKLSTTNSLYVNSRNVYTAVVIDQDTIRMGSGPSFLFITNKALQPYSPYPQQPYQQPYQQLSQPQRKTSWWPLGIPLGVLIILVMCAAISPQAAGSMAGVVVCAAVPVLFIWALVTMNNKPKPYTVPYTPSYPVLSQSATYQEQHVVYDSYNTEDSYNTSQQTINVYCENFIYYGQPPRGTIGRPNMVVDEDEDEDEDEY